MARERGWIDEERNQPGATVPPMDVVGPFAVDATLITALVFVGLLVLAMIGMVGLVRRGGISISKVIGLTMLGCDHRGTPVGGHHPADGTTPSLTVEA